MRLAWTVSAAVASRGRITRSRGGGGGSRPSQTALRYSRPHWMRLRSAAAAAAAAAAARSRSSALLPMTLVSVLPFKVHIASAPTLQPAGAGDRPDPSCASSMPAAGPGLRGTHILCAPPQPSIAGQTQPKVEGKLGYLVLEISLFYDIMMMVIC
jgi:hypothetical protein